MTDMSQTPSRQWTMKRAVLLAMVCMAAGIAGGWSIRASQNSLRRATVATPAVVSALAATVATPAQNVGAPATQAPNPAQLKEMADAQAAPLLNQLKANPASPEVLTSIGNIYYDAQQYPVAIDYYARALKARPSDAAVRTDMATAYWYIGDAERAIAEFDNALTYAPNNANTLFNRGLVRWKGKNDAAGALGDWEKLLATNPHYEGKNKVAEMLAEVRSSAGQRVAATR